MFFVLMYWLMSITSLFVALGILLSADILIKPLSMLIDNRLIHYATYV